MTKHPLLKKAAWSALSRMSFLCALALAGCATTKGTFEFEQPMISARPPLGAMPLGLPSPVATGLVAVVNPVRFPDHPRLDPGQAAVAREIQSEFVARLHRAQLFSQVIPVGQPGAAAPPADGSKTITFDVQMRDRLDYWPFYWVVLAGEREKYQLDCVVDLSYQGRPLNRYAFSRFDERMQGMWWMEVLVPLFPVYAPEPGILQRQLATQLFMDFENFLNWSRGQIFAATGAPAQSPPLVPGMAPAPFPQPFGAPVFATNESTSWQRLRAPTVPVHSVALGLGYQIDMPSTETYGNTSVFEGGLRFELEYAFRPLAFLDQSQFAKTGVARSPSRFIPELFAGIAYSDLYRYVDSDRTATTSGRGGHTHLQFQVGPRFVFQTTLRGAFFADASFGRTKDTANHTFASNDPVVFEGSGSHNTITLGGGFRMGGMSDPLHLEAAFHVIFATNTGPDTYFFICPVLRGRYNLGAGL